MTIEEFKTPFQMMNLIKFSKEFLFSFLKEVPSSLFSVPDIFISHQNEFMQSKIKCLFHQTLNNWKYPEPYNGFYPVYQAYKNIDGARANWESLIFLTEYMGGYITIRFL